MHCYEVIPEGAVCKMYFDLEFHKPSNRGSDGRSMVALLIQVEIMVPQLMCFNFRDRYSLPEKWTFY